MGFLSYRLYCIRRGISTQSSWRVHPKRKRKTLALVFDDDESHHRVGQLPATVSSAGRRREEEKKNSWLGDIPHTKTQTTALQFQKTLTTHPFDVGNYVIARRIGATEKRPKPQTTSTGSVGMHVGWWYPPNNGGEFFSNDDHQQERGGEMPTRAVLLLLRHISTRV